MTFEAILYLAVLIIAAKLCGEAFHRIKQPTIIGNVIAGIIVGPALFAIVRPIDELEVFISIGIFFLFFLIGLQEIDLPGLFRVLRGRIFAGSAIGFLIPFIVAGLYGLSLDMEFVKSFAIASVIGASSLGVTAKILTDLGKLRSAIGLEIFTVTAVIEIIAIIFTSVFIQFESSEQLPDITEIIWLFAKMIIFFVIAGVLSVFVLSHFFRIIKKHLQVQQVYFGLVIGIILLVAYFAEISGIHGVIGALLLGIAVSRMTKEEYNEISKSVNAIGNGIFIPIFFAGIGLHFTINFLDLPIWIIGGFLAIIIGVKFVASYIAVKIAHMRPATTVAYGVMAKGAVDLALMLTLFEAKMLEGALFSLLVLGTLITMIISSVELQRKLSKVISVKVGTTELALYPVYFRQVISDYTAKDVMDTNFKRVSPDITLQQFVNSNEIDSKSVYLVIDNNDQLVGLVSKRELSRINKKNYNAVRVYNIMIERFQAVVPDEYLFSVIQKLNTHTFDLIPVVSNITSKKAVGVVTSEDILDLVVKEKQKSS